VKTVDLTSWVTVTPTPSSPLNTKKTDGGKTAKAAREGVVPRPKLGNVGRVNMKAPGHNQVTPILHHHLLRRDSDVTRARAQTVVLPAVTTLQRRRQCLHLAARTSEALVQRER